MPPDFSSGGSVISIGDTVRKRLHGTGCIPALGSSAGKFFHFFFSGTFGQFARGRVTPGHQFVRILRPADHPVMACTLVVRLNVKRHDIGAYRFFHPTPLIGFDRSLRFQPHWILN